MFRLIRDEILNDEDNFEIRAPREPVDEEIHRPEPAPLTLMDHLLEQLHLAPLTEKESKIGEYLLWCINDDGYLTGDIESIAENLGEPPERVEKVLLIIQRFDPPGIGARDLQECLLIQLGEKDPIVTAGRVAGAQIPIGSRGVQHRHQLIPGPQYRRDGICDL